MSADLNLSAAETSGPAQAVSVPAQGFMIAPVIAAASPSAVRDNHGTGSGRRSYSFRSAFLFLQWLAVKLVQGILIVLVLMGSAIFFPSLALAITLWERVTKPKQTFEEKINEVRMSTH